MAIDMNEIVLKAVAQTHAFLSGTRDVQFEPLGEDSKRYAFIAAMLKRLDYPRLARPDKSAFGSNPLILPSINGIYFSESYFPKHARTRT